MTDHQFPKDEEMEKAVLGSLIAGYASMNDLSELLSIDLFYNNDHRIAYEALLHMSKNDIAIDALGVAETLKKLGKLNQLNGKLYGITSLINKAVDNHLALQHCLVLKEKYMRRQLIRESYKNLELAIDETNDVFDTLAIAEKKIADITNFDIRLGTSYQDKIINKTKKGIEERIKLRKEGRSIGLQTGLSSFDKLTGGLLAGEVVVLAARPGAGKTLCACSIADYCPNPVGIFSQEMKEEILLQRVVSNSCNVPFENIKSGSITDSQKLRIEKKLDEYKNKIFILNDSDIDVWGIKKQATTWVKERGVKLIMVDYLQLINLGEKTQSKEQEVSKVIRALKALASKLDIPIIVLSQLSRETEKRSDKRPKLSDLRDSGDIEQAADIVVFIYRLSMYMSAEKMLADGVNPSDAELIVAKHRNGVPAILDVKYNGDYMRFSDVESTNQNPYAKEDDEVSF